ncbi:hypothetical protein GPECTOR_35g946 [Gonium pectorale]|uniref:PPPDE domain-containing protein n=1 Tax=Gonium pectorale TaxID=33097 RepID=A0A150GCF8_GONPE|nr:hypothetical protein GPECTOR_35g946 [Gonium pectorale]|eukprot:KXZ47508.1 hypothetical protein GPECTOR_35g946 [Gonium pectorale]
MKLEADGVYIHKRPIRAPNGSSPLAVCGSVLHHVVVYVKEGPLLHTLDYGPANGADVTANILEEAPPKKVLTTAASDGADVGGVDAASDELPYLYLGPAARGLEHPVVQRMISFAESRPYHAIRNNCIHFADALVRLLTAGGVRGAPLLYDMYCGAVPPVDNLMLVMMQLMMSVSWFTVVDGTPLASAFADAWRAEQQPLPQQPLAAAFALAPSAAAPAANGDEEEEAVATAAESRNNQGGSDSTAAIDASTAAAPAAAAAVARAGPPLPDALASGSEMDVEVEPEAESRGAHSQGVPAPPPEVEVTHGSSPRDEQRLAAASGEQEQQGVAGCGGSQEERRLERDNDLAAGPTAATVDVEGSGTAEAAPAKQPLQPPPVRMPSLPVRKARKA